MLRFLELIPKEIRDKVQYTGAGKRTLDLSFCRTSSTATCSCAGSTLESTRVTSDSSHPMPPKSSPISPSSRGSYPGPGSTSKSSLGAPLDVKKSPGPSAKGSSSSSSTSSPIPRPDISTAPPSSSSSTVPSRSLRSRSSRRNSSKSS